MFPKWNQPITLRRPSARSSSSWRTTVATLPKHSPSVVSIEPSASVGHRIDRLAALVDVDRHLTMPAQRLLYLAQCLCVGVRDAEAPKHVHLADLGIDRVVRHARRRADRAIAIETLRELRDRLQSEENRQPFRTRFAQRLVGR